MDIVKKTEDIFPNFSHFLNIDTWGETQKALSDVTGLPIGLYDERLTPIVPPVISNKINNLLSGNKEWIENYNNFLKNTIKMSLLSDGHLIIRSPSNQHIFIIPVQIAKNDFLFIIGGDSYITYDDFSYFVDNLNDFGLPQNSLLPIGKDIPFRSYKNIESVARLVMHVGNNMLLKNKYKSVLDTGSKQNMILGLMIEFAKASSCEEALRQIFQSLCILFNVDSMSVVFRDGEYFMPLHTFGNMKDALHGLLLKDSIPFIAKMISDNNPVFLETNEELIDAGIYEKFSSAALLPLRRRESIFGLIAIYNTPMSSHDKEILTNFASLFSYSWEYLNMKEEHKRIKKELSVFVDTYKNFSSTLEDGTLYDIILEKCTELTGAEHASLMILDKERMELVGMAVRGVNKKLAEHLRVRVGEGIAGKVCESSLPMIVKDLEDDPRIKKENRSRYKTRSFISMPLIVGNQTVGVINLTDKASGDIFTEMDLKILQSFAAYASIALERLEFLKMSEDLRKIARTDPLTELLNRRYFHERLGEEMERAKRHGQPLSFIMLDIDNFKHFNDTMGHIAGDTALKLVAKIIRNTVRSIDIIARYGGEEFSIVLPQTEKEISRVIAERIRFEVEQAIVPHNEISNAKLTISMGLASFPEDAVEILDLINCADKALYAAKASGKNKLCVSSGGK